MYKGYKVFKVYKMYKVYKVCKVYEVLLPPATQASYPTSVGFIGRSEVGGCSTGKSFRFVRACVRAVWLPSGIGSKILLAGLFPFPFGPGLVVGLFLFWAEWSWAAFPFPF